MSLTSYQAAPPRVLNAYYGAPETERKRKIRFTRFSRCKEEKTELAAESCVGKIYAPSIGGRDDPE
jgi:hypothetical protein